MSSGGLSESRLTRMHEVMAGYVERGEVPGIVTLIRRHGEVHVDAIGTKAVGHDDPVKRDTIFRIASMSKPVAAAAAMILVEESKLHLDDPVDRLAARVVEPQGLAANRRSTERYGGGPARHHLARPAHLPHGTGNRRWRHRILIRSRRP